MHKPPVVTAGANVTFTEGSGPVLADSTLALSDSDSIKSATVAITGGFLAGDTLDFNNGTENFETFTNSDGTTSTISASFNTASGVLTLTAVGGSASFTDFQTALDHVRFVNPGDPTGGGTDPTRTLTWTVVDTNQTAINTGSSTSTINTVHTPPSVPTGGTGVLVTYTEGQTTTTLLDSGVTLADSDPIKSATVSVSGYQSGDILDFAGNTAIENGVLTLTTTGAATASATDYTQALASVEFRETAGDDPTHGGAASETARTVSWTVTDTNTNTASNSVSFSSTLDTVHKPPVVTAGANITFTDGNGPMLADSTLALSDSNSIKSAAVAITGGFLAGDTLDFNNGSENFETFTNSDGTTSAISASFNTASGVLTLTALGGSASFTDFQTALDHVRFVNPGDPTGGGTDPTRTLTWTVVDTNQTAINTGSSTSTINTAHTPPSISGTNGVTVTYSEGQTTTTFLDSGLVVSNDTLESATVTVSGFQSGDILSVGNLNGLTLTSDANGTIVLSGLGTSQQYQTALHSISFSETAGDDPTHGGAASETARSVTWTVVDDANAAATATTALDTVHTLSVTAGVTVTFAAGQTGRLSSTAAWR